MNDFAPLKVTLHGMDERAAQMFSMFLAGPARGCCVVVPEGQQEAVVVDLDGIGADRLWLDVRRRFSGPALVLSVREKQLRHSIWVPKPIRADALIDAVKRIRIELDTLAVSQPKAVQAESAAVIGHDEVHTATQRAEAERQAQASAPAARGGTAEEERGGGASRAAKLAFEERRVHECCGDLADEVYRDPRRRAELFFAPEDTLLGVMREALDLVKASRMPVMVEGLGRSLILCADQRHLFSDMREQYLRPLCTRLRRQTPMHVHTIPPEEMPVTTSVDPRLQRIDATLWKIALWTARGRVPHGTILEAPVALRAWPNLTRFQLIPGAMQIAALWIKQPSGLMATAEHLGLPYRYVFSFFTACQALDLVDEAAAASAGATSLSAQGVSQDRRGLFKRMLSKLGLG
ncbi:MAG: hypothetical protein ABWU16_08705 [Halothiobacillaceae bacterium]